MKMNSCKQVSKNHSQQIISASRRSDIPAFEGDRFLQAVEQGEIFVPNPFNSKKYRVSLKPEDVSAIVFWSRNYEPFLQVLDKIRDKYGDRFLFHFTINGYQGRSKGLLEPDAPDLVRSIDCVKILAERFNSKKIFWRFDPVIFSNLNSHQERLQTFEKIAIEINKYVARCYFSFIDIYRKVKRRLRSIEHTLVLKNPARNELIDFARGMDRIAEKHDLPLFGCCEDFVLSETKIKKAHCIDAKYLSELYPETDFTGQIKPTREGCGCYTSRDIGEYNNCKYDCLYCYANK